MKVRIKFFGQFSSQGEKLKEGEMEVKKGALLKDLIEILGIPERELGPVFINKKHGFRDSPLSEGDSVSFFPPIGGG